jgi:thiazole synthase ThiGH ThiG subunit
MIFLLLVPVVVERMTADDTLNPNHTQTFFSAEAILESGYITLKYLEKS